MQNVICLVFNPPAFYQEFLSSNTNKLMTHFLFEHFILKVQSAPTYSSCSVLSGVSPPAAWRGCLVTVLCVIQLPLPGVSLPVDALQLHCLRLHLVTDVLVLLSSLSELGIAGEEPVVNHL